MRLSGAPILTIHNASFIMLPSLMHRFHTQRLTGFPLSYQQVLHYLACDGYLEQELALRTGKRIVDAAFQSILEEQVLPAIEQEESPSPLASLWLLVDRQKHRIVGSIVFKHPPNAKGEASIGYQTEQGYHDQGYMTEALAGLIEWATEHSPLRLLLATTPLNQPDAQNILKDNQFEPYQILDNHQHWRHILR